MTFIFWRSAQQASCFFVKRHFILSVLVSFVYQLEPILILILLVGDNTVLYIVPLPLVQMVMLLLLKFGVSGSVKTESEFIELGIDNIIITVPTEIFVEVSLRYRLLSKIKKIRIQRYGLR